jgi:2-oxoglutarate dehydrogenase dihydrolipoamide succinyltransferase (E2 component)
VSSLPTDVSVEVTMPQMGVSVAEGTVVAWHKRVGDWVEADETLCEISTDKVDTEVPSPATGRVLEIVAEVEQTVAVGALLARIGTDAVAGEAHPDEHLDEGGGAPARAEQSSAPNEHERLAPAGGGQRPAPPDEHERLAPAGRGQRPAPPDEHEPSAPGAANGHAHYSPVVLRIAQREGVDLTHVNGSGRDGRVRKQDLLAFIQERGDGLQESPLHIDSPYKEEPAPAPAAGEQGERLSRMRRSIAEHMVHSLQTAAHCTSINEADMSALEDERHRLGLSYLPFVARCTIDALQEHPALNATLDGETLVRHADVNLGIAVSLGEDGLIVPVIHRAQELSHQGLAARIVELAQRARAGQLSPDEVHGGTFTITNPGGYGTLASTPIINQPQVAILDLEAVVKRPVVVSDDAGRDSIAIRPMAYLCLSWDHRALDGALAAQFLAALRRRIEKWGGA